MAGKLAWMCALAASLTHVATALNNSTRFNSTSVGCRDDDGNPVDYWYALKVPKVTTYAYSDAHGGELTMSSEDMGSAYDGALAQTLQQIYAGNSDVGYAMYNDETPDKHTEESRAHSKGVVAFGSEGGPWPWSCAFCAQHFSARRLQYCCVRSRTVQYLRP